MAESKMKDSVNRRYRVSRACDYCRLKKARCDSALPCATCVQRNVPCIRRNRRKDTKKPHEYHDTLVKAVHALYQASQFKGKMADNTEITTHAILESLDLIEQTDSDAEAKFEIPGSRDARSPSASTDSSPDPIFTNSEKSSGSTSMSSVSHQPTSFTESLPSPHSFQPIIGLQTVSEDAPAAVPSWQTPSALMTADDFNLFDSHHPMMPLFGTDLPKENELHSSAVMMNTAPRAGAFDDTIFAVFNDFSLYDEPVDDIESFSPEDFGFDPVPCPSKRNSVKTAEVGTIDNWHGFVRHAKNTNLENRSTGSQPPTHTSSLHEAHNWTGDNPSTFAVEASSHETGISSQTFSSEPTSEQSPPTMPLRRRSVEDSKSENPDKPSPIAITPTRRPYKRSRKNSESSISAGSQGPESDKLRISREKNRQAASKCREKKRIEISKLMEVSRDVTAENSLLKQQKMEMQGELLDLRRKLSHSHFSAL